MNPLNDGIVAVSSDTAWNKQTRIKLVSRYNTVCTPNAGTFQLSFYQWMLLYTRTSSSSTLNGGSWCVRGWDKDLHRAGGGLRNTAIVLRSQKLTCRARGPRGVCLRVRCKRKDPHKCRKSHGRNSNLRKMGGARRVCAKSCQQGNAHYSLCWFSKHSENGGRQLQTVARDQQESRLDEVSREIFSQLGVDIHPQSRLFVGSRTPWPSSSNSGDFPNWRQSYLFWTRS